MESTQPISWCAWLVAVWFSWDVNSQGQPEASPEPRPSLYCNSIIFQHCQPAVILSGICEYLVVFLVLLFLEISENVIVSPSVYKIKFLELVFAEQDFRLWLGWTLSTFTEVISENTEINVKYFSLRLLLSKAFENLFGNTGCISFDMCLDFLLTTGIV